MTPPLLSGPSSVELTDDSLVAQHSRPLITLKRSCFGETPSYSSREPGGKKTEKKRKDGGGETEIKFSEVR